MTVLLFLRQIDWGNFMSRKKSYRCKMTKLEQGIFAHEERKACVALK